MNSRLALAALFSIVIAAPAQGAITAFRFSDLDLRDPHMFVSFLGCRDFTDTPLVGLSINGNLQQDIQTDGDGDGRLDLSYLILFDPLNPAGQGGTLRFGIADCDTPMAGTTCAGGEQMTTVAYQNSAAGTCLGALAGTLRPYTPAVTATSAPCFVTSDMIVTLDLGGIPMTLRSARVAATYVGASPTTLVNGLLRGFLTESDANTTIIPASFPLVGGQPLSALLPGGDPPGPNNTCCAPYSDKDVDNNVPGWWFYLNFTATKTDWSEPVSVPEGGGEFTVAHAYPNPFGRSLAIHYALQRAGTVEISIHDPQGRLVADLERGTQEAGAHAATWDGHGPGGRPMEAGIYFVRFTANGSTVTRRVALLR